MVKEKGILAQAIWFSVKSVYPRRQATFQTVYANLIIVFQPWQPLLQSWLTFCVSLHGGRGVSSWRSQSFHCVCQSQGHLEWDFLAIPQDGILRFGMASCLCFWLYAWTFSWCKICGQIYLLVWKLTVVILAFIPNKFKQRLCTKRTISAVLLCLDIPHTESHLTHHMWLEKPTVPASLLGIR